MKKIFLNCNSINSGDEAIIEGDDHHHLSNVLRVKINEKFIVQGHNGMEFIGKVSSVNKKFLTIKLESLYKRPEIKRPETTIFFSLLKGDKNEYLIQKCTEAGIDRFVPVITKNTIIDIKDKQDKKLNRFKNIAKEAAMQSCREKIPEIFKIILFEEIKNYGINCINYFGYIDQNCKKFYEELKNIKNNDKVNFFIGPEGDFSGAEIDYLLKNNWKGISLSEFILKSETCAVFFASGIYSYFYNT